MCICCIFCVQRRIPYGTKQDLNGLTSFVQESMRNCLAVPRRSRRYQIVEITRTLLHCFAYIAAYRELSQVGERDMSHIV